VEARFPGLLTVPGRRRFDAIVLSTGQPDRAGKRANETRTHSSPTNRTRDLAQQQVGRVGFISTLYFWGG